MHSRAAKLNQVCAEHAIVQSRSMYVSRTAKRSVLSQPDVTSAWNEHARRLGYYHYGAASCRATFAPLNHSVYTVATLSRSYPIYKLTIYREKRRASMESTFAIFYRWNSDLVDRRPGVSCHCRGSNWQVNYAVVATRYGGKKRTG